MSPFYMIENHLSTLFLIFYHVFLIFCEVHLISNHLYYIIVLKKRKKKITMNKERHSEIGAKIKSLREKNNMEQLELASRMGYKSQSTISKWESGVNLPTGKKLIELAKLLNTTTNEILGIDTSSPPAETPQFRAIQRKAKSLSVADQERLIQIMDLTFQDVLNGGGDDEHDF